ncbi:hypothetical protein VTL71DRAFT_1240 [Oculimacula yallundae]|uniref:Uncharacterized protein n=1 Tax=Oculimacula yallundae TaxID=86028 RepID=A0ABR4CBH1_9HELO
MWKMEVQMGLKEEYRRQKTFGAATEADIQRTELVPANNVDTVCYRADYYPLQSNTIQLWLKPPRNEAWELCNYTIGGLTTWEPTKVEPRYTISSYGGMKAQSFQLEINTAKPIPWGTPVTIEVNLAGNLDFYSHFTIAFDLGPPVANGALVVMSCAYKTVHFDGI